MVTRTPALLAPSLLVMLFGCSGQPGGLPQSEVVVTNADQALRPPSGGELVVIPAGRFVMGDVAGRADETAHEVGVSSFLMDRHPVTQQMYETVTDANPSKRQAKDHPVERTQWVDAARYCNKCSLLDGLTPCYDLETWQCDFKADGYRLPTEAEWEYACRAGSQTQYYFGDDDAELAKYAWCKPGSRGRSHPVGEKRANACGLFDMHGNVWEWCHDYYSATYYAESPSHDPRGPSTGKQRVLRGGAWNANVEKCRAAFRFQEFPVFTDACFGSDSYGFRRVRNIAAAPRNKSLVRSTPSPVEQPRQAAAVQPPPTGSSSQATSSEVTAREAASQEVAAARTGSLDASRLKGTLIFVSDRSGALDLWKMHASGRHLKQLTNDSHPDADPRFSPDGQRIIYTSLRDGFPEIWMINRDASMPVRITDGSQAAWSPDGDSIIFVRDDQAFIRALETGVERRVTPENWQRCGVPTWSPDGKQVAVASRHLGNIGIFVLNLENQQHSQLLTEEPCCTPQWSHDGKRVIFQTVQGHIHELDIESRTEEQLTFGADIQHDARYSPDGSLLVFCRAPTSQGPWQLCLVDLDSDDLDTVQITDVGSNRLPDWHPLEDE